MTVFPYFVLLESGDRQRGRYDILSAYPWEQIKLSPEEGSVNMVLNNYKAKEDGL